MKYLRNFLIAVAIVFFGMALGNAALANHDTDTPVWLVVVDWDDRGNAFIEQNFEPFAFANLFICTMMGKRQADMIGILEPERRFLSVCLHPETETLEQIIASIMKEFSKFFPPIGLGV